MVTGESLTVEKVFKAFDGAQVVAGLLGVTAQAVSNMKQRGSIPSRHWAKLVEAARARDLGAVITFDALASIQRAQGVAESREAAQ